MNGRCRPPSARVANGVITHAPSGRKTTYGKVAAAAAKLDAAEGRARSRIRRTGRSPASRWRASTRPTRSPAARSTASTSSCPACSTPRSRTARCSAARSRASTPPRSHGMPGVKKVRAGRRHRRRRGGRHLVARQDRARCPADRVGRGPERQGLERDRSRQMLKDGLDAEQAFVGNKNGDAQGRDRRRRQKVEAVYAYPYQNHATDGADERHGAAGRRSAAKCWTPTQNGEAALAATAEAAGPAGRQMRGLQACRSAAASAGAARPDCVRQAVLIAKEMPGTPVKLIWTREEDMTHGRYHPVTQCKMTAGSTTNGNLTGLHMRISGQSILAGVAPAALENGTDPSTFQGLTPSGRRARSATRSEPADRPRDAQPARAAGLLARREPQPERDLPRVLHGRAGARRRPGSARVPRAS